MEKTFLLVAIFGANAPRIIAQGSAAHVQAIRTKIKGEQQYRGWLLQVRTAEGFQAVPVLKRKNKAKATLPG